MAAAAGAATGEKARRRPTDGRINRDKESCRGGFGLKIPGGRCCQQMKTNKHKLTTPRRGTKRDAPFRARNTAAQNCRRAAGGDCRDRRLGGNLEVLQTVLRDIPAEFEMAIVIVQHLAPHVPSMIADLLAATRSCTWKRSTGRWRSGRGDLRHAAGCADGGERQPVAAGAGERGRDAQRHRLFSHEPVQEAIGVVVGMVLSGSSSDGAVGLREVKGAGGITLVQDPRSTRFDAAPRAAIMTGAADRVLKPEEIAGELVNIWRHPLVRSNQASSRSKPEEL